jgi:hypothetical protein
MKLGLQNYAAVMPVENGSIKFSNKLKYFTKDDTVQNYKILHSVV